jgi:CRP-like cAMP-binding protein
MPRKSAPATYHNRLLRAFSADDLASVQPHLQSVSLERGKTLERANKKIEYLYFPTSGMASVIGGSATADKDVEIGIMGYEGVTGLPVIYGDDRSPHETFVQIAGEANRISAARFRTAIDASSTLQQLLLKYAQCFMIQTAHTAVANARGHLEQRLARWLLMAQDRTESDSIPLTHEFLSLMLAVRRPGVTEAVHELTRKGLIAHRKGNLIVRDRHGLIESAGGLYGTPEREYERLLG